MLGVVAPPTRGNAAAHSGFAVWGSSTFKEVMGKSPAAGESADVRAVESLTFPSNAGTGGNTSLIFNSLSSGDTRQSPGAWAGGERSPRRRTAPFLEYPGSQGHGAGPPVPCVCESCPGERTAPTATSHQGVFSPAPCFSNFPMFLAELCPPKFLH